MEEPYYREAVALRIESDKPIGPVMQPIEVLEGKPCFCTNAGIFVVARNLEKDHIIERSRRLSERFGRRRANAGTRVMLQ